MHGDIYYDKQFYKKYHLLPASAENGYNFFQREYSLRRQQIRYVDLHDDKNLVLQPNIICFFENILPADF